MGTLQTTSIMIKLLLGSALLAFTAAEADPQVNLYGTLPYPYAAGVPVVGDLPESGPNADAAADDGYRPYPYRLPYAGVPVLFAPAPAGDPVVAERKKREADPQDNLPYSNAAPATFSPVGAVAYTLSVVDTPAVHADSLGLDPSTYGSKSDYIGRSQ